MDDKSETRANRRRLKALLDRAGYTSVHHSGALFGIPSGGTLRSWDMRTALCNGWVSWSIYMLRWPSAPHAAAALAQRVLELNDVMSVAKFSKHGDALTLDMEYRVEHVDPESFENLTNLVFGFAEEHYPELFRIANGTESLKRLEDAFRRPALGGGED
ncbi:MAG: hypothetical protein KGN02_13695 [bacterium]|nr:hypothetical protein [bacterium]